MEYTAYCYDRKLDEIERSGLDFGIKDTKGRAVGYGWIVFQAVFTKRAEGQNGWCLPVGMPENCFMIRGFPTRNGLHYGASNGYLFAATRADADLLIAKRIKQARKRETKRFVEVAK